MPRLNEAETLANCIQQAGFGAEIIVAANGSTDGSQVIVKELGVRVVPIATRGYGSALIGGIAAACGRFTQQCDQGMAPVSMLIGRSLKGGRRRPCGAAPTATTIRSTSANFSAPRFIDGQRGDVQSYDSPDATRPPRRGKGKVGKLRGLGGQDPRRR